MAGNGTGYPNWFLCPVERRERNEARWRYGITIQRHRVTLTGATKPAPGAGRGHPRKSTLSREYDCSCGHHGWSCHVDLERMSDI